MHAQWTRIRDRLQQLGCLDNMALLPGASAADLAALEQHLGASLPASLKDFLSVHNGQAGFGLMRGESLLSTTGIRQAWDNWRSIDEAEMNEDCAEFMGSDPAGAIKPLYCNPAWIPLTHDGGGNHVGLDFDPDRAGTAGQVIAFGRDEDVKRLLADSFEPFVEECIAWLERAVWNGKYLDAGAAA